MSERILKYTAAAFAFAFICVGGTFALGVVVQGAGVSNAVSAGAETAKSIYRFHVMLDAIAAIEERALEHARENNRASALSRI